MRLTNIFIFLFLLSAFAIGAGMYQFEIENVNLVLDNASTTLSDFSLEKGNETYSSSMITIVEKGVQFAGVFGIEIIRVGGFFGQENPEYFEPAFIIKIIYLIIWLTIIGLLIRPLSYLVIFLILMGILIVESYKKRKEKWKQKQ